MLRVHHCRGSLDYEVLCAELQIENDSKYLMDAGYRFSKFPPPDAMQGHDKMYSLCYYSFFCIDPTLEQTSLLSNTKAV